MGRVDEARWQLHLADSAANEMALARAALVGLIDMADRLRFRDAYVLCRHAAQERPDPGDAGADALVRLPRLAEQRLNPCDDVRLDCHRRIGALDLLHPLLPERDRFAKIPMVASQERHA